MNVRLLTGDAPPTPALPHKGGGSFWIPCAPWVKGNLIPSPLVGEG